MVKSLISLAIFALFVLLAWHFGRDFLPLGKLPGDLNIQRGNTRIFVPITTCIVLSLAYSLFAWIVRKLTA
jgi:hypothetical protein